MAADGMGVSVWHQQATLPDAALAAALAAETGARLLSLRQGAPALSDGQLGQRGDALAHELLVARLSLARPGDAILSEEGADEPWRLDSGRVWIVDPLDGTREFSERRPDWAVHVALWQDGGLVAGAVALPDLKTVLSTCSPIATPLRAAGGRPRMAVSRTRPPDVAAAAAARLGADVVPMGSAGFKVAAVIRGEVDMYVHAGGQYEWDSAAPVAVALSAGLHASRLDGSPLMYNQPTPSLPDLVVCRPDLAPELLNVLDDLTGARAQLA